jgi:multiple antibiotic resistance protein
MRQFLFAFIPLFVAIDAIGILPFYLGLTSGLAEKERRKIGFEATLTAGAVGSGFLLVGDLVLQVLGVSVADLQVAGGVLLLVLSIYDLLHPVAPLRQVGAQMSVVPLGIPMIAGPAVLTTLLTLARSVGYLVTLAAFALNLLIVGAVLRWATLVERAIGEAGARAVAKVASLLLAAFAVTMIRTGLTAILSLSR